MHDDRTLVEDRLARVLSQRLRPAIYPLAAPLTIEAWQAPGEPVPVAEGLAATHSPVRVGDPWGPPWGTTWFKLTGQVPAEWAGHAVEVIVDLGFNGRDVGFQCEGLAYRADGTVVKGVHPDNAWLPVGDPVSGGEQVEFHVEAGANPVVLHDFLPTELGDLSTAGSAPQYRIQRVELAVFDTEVFELVQDLEVLDGLMRELDTGSPRRWQILRAIERSLDRIELGDIAATATVARAELADVLASPATASAHQLSAVGHAHIDSAWLWPLRETVRKVARTIANVTALMDDHPEFVFAMSQAQQLAWIKQHRPEVFAKVAKKIAEGQFVPVGGMWVESDTNMPGGEALARQFVHGKRFYLDEFGIETEEVWLPDSFGYTGALPQLVALSGSRWFLTQKISWNQQNKFPHHTFRWEGIDGTRVFTHFPPVDTYTATLSGREVAHASRNFADKGAATRSLVPFGYGDGGGGPTREMLARAKRLADLEGSPRVTIESPAEFFTKAEQDYPHPPVWVGELYLEIHRGTYTSQAKTKLGNRRSEHLLREAELWAATAAVRTGAAYPYEQLDRVWKTVLLNQFHDILPGSSIAWVYRDAELSYAQVAADLAPLIDTAQAALAGEGSIPLTFNAAPHSRAGVPALGAAVLAEPSGGVSVTAVDGGFRLDNGALALTVDARGLLTSVYDQAAEREVVAPGAAANLLQLHPDFPNRWDAWDVDAFYRNTVTDLTDLDELTVATQTPTAVELRIRRSFGRSAVTQTLRLTAGARQVDLGTEVDWQETEKFLKLAFPLDLHALHSSAETQFGHIDRPTHSNTSWDAARFEICAHRWIRVAEPGYGVALANDANYGHDVTRSARPGGGTVTTVRASLLRAARFPDPDADHGVHHFRHALVVGAEVTDAVREGYRINLPARIVDGAAPVEPLLSVTNPAVVVEAVKLADDRSGDVVVRLYESRGGRAVTDVRPHFTSRSVLRTDLLERPLADAEPEPLPLHLRPFEIVTLRFRTGTE
ncbi:MAG TPA: glycoside hydrolase family 38 C-terminal domain-containing protein [Pseudonocardiaceae bacterium]|jgi:alpha-mannosidase|nr:glycoside hydrolase family 38 C-terminal domain-containing protein [Pseudonocardiaceae bacterium]